MGKLLTIGAAAKALGVSTSTLRRWEAGGRLVPARTEGGQRRYDLATLTPRHIQDALAARKTVAYARVSHHDRGDELARQKQMLALFCASHGWEFESIGDVGPGTDLNRDGLRRLIAGIVDGSVGRLVLVHGDRLLTFGSELVLAICEAQQVEVVVIDQGSDDMLGDELAGDVMQVVAVLSSRLDGERTPRHRALINGVRALVKDASC